VVAEFVSALNQKGMSGKQQALLNQLLEGRQLALADYRAYKAGDVPGTKPNLSQASESSHGGAVDQVEFEGRVFSRSMLNYMNLLVFLKRHVDCSGIARVLEIGGGFGTLGEILLSDPDHTYTYVDLDIPPTLYPASWYLSRIAGGSFVSALDASEGEIDVASIRGKTCVFPTWYLPRIVGSFDLFVNSISFQEMEPFVVRNYAQHIARLNCTYVLLRNLREGKPLKRSGIAHGVDEPMLAATYDEIFTSSGYRFVADNVHPFGFQTADGFHSELRLYERVG